MRKYDDPNCVLDTGDLEDIIADFDRFYAESREYYKDAVSSDFEKIGHVLYSFSFNLKEELRREIAGWISQKIDGNPPIVRMYLYSLVLGICPDSATVGQALDYLLDNTGYFTKNNLYYYAYQLMVITFSRQEADSIDIRIKLWKLLNLIYEIFEKEVTVSLETIPMEKRNPNLILVLTEQMVTVEHGPTKTALDRCKAIMTRMDKEVLLICTNEILSLAGKFPFAGVAFGHEGQYEDAEEIEWKGVRIPFFNVKESMPNVDVIDELLGLIRKLAPSRIVTIGGKGVLANLADRIIPCVDIGLCPSAIEPTSVSYQTLGRPMEVMRWSFYRQ